MNTTAAFPCSECAGTPAYVPRIGVLNHETGGVEVYHLMAPAVCDACAKRKHMTRIGFYLPKAECQRAFEALEAAHQSFRDHRAKADAAVVAHLISTGLTEQEARAMLGIDT